MDLKEVIRFLDIAMKALSFELDKEIIFSLPASIGIALLTYNIIVKAILQRSNLLCFDLDFGISKHQWKSVGLKKLRKLIFWHPCFEVCSSFYLSFTTQFTCLLLVVLPPPSLLALLLKTLLLLLLFALP